MADNNNIVEILIRFGLEEANARKAVAEMDTLKKKSVEANKEGAKAAEEHTKKISGLDKALNLLGNQFGDIGRIVGFAFKHPIAAATAAAAIGLRQVQTAAAGVEAIFVRMAESSGGALTNFSGSMRQVMLEFIQSNTAFKESQEKLDQQMDAATKKVEAQRDASLQLLAARKALEMAGATGDGERKQIEEKYRRLEEETKLRSEQERIALNELRLQTLKTEQKNQEAEAARLLHGLSKEAAQVALTDLQKTTIPKLAADEQSAKADLAAFETAMASPVGAAALLTKYGSVAEIQNAHAVLQGRVFQSGRSIGRARNQETNLTAGLAALSAAGTLGGQIATGSADLDAARTRQTAGGIAETMRGGGSIAGTIADAAGGADAILGGGKASTGQAAAINHLVKLLGLQGLTNAQIIQMLARMNDSQEAFANSLKAVQQKISQGGIKP